jgi:pimeloyl-ACP methyl ester carboxylesterase
VDQHQLKITASALSLNVITLLKKLKLKNFIFIGISFGSAILDKVIENYDELGLVKKVVIVAGSEFFSYLNKVLIHLAFLPARLSGFIRNLYKKYYTKDGKYPDILKSDVKSILDQWLSIINYWVDTKKKFNLPTLIVSLKNDVVVRRDSVAKLRQKYPNNVYITIEGEHSTRFCHEEGSRFIPELIENIEILDASKTNPTLS